MAHLRSAGSRDRLSQREWDRVRQRDRLAEVRTSGAPLQLGIAGPRCPESSGENFWLYGPPRLMRETGTWATNHTSLFDGQNGSPASGIPAASSGREAG